VGATKKLIDGKQLLKDAKNKVKIKKQKAKEEYMEKTERSVATIGLTILTVTIQFRVLLRKA
jgi:hypothetical protein